MKEPLVAPSESISFEQKLAKQQVKKLCEVIETNDVSLIIVDTVSEAIGLCDEVQHDKFIKRAFQNIVAETGVTILLVHHINKSKIRGEQKITMASGAGLTSVMRLSKLILSLTLSNLGKRILKFEKANFLKNKSPAEIPLEFYENILVAFSEFKIERTIPLPKNTTNRRKSKPRAKPIIISPQLKYENDKKLEDRRWDAF